MNPELVPQLIAEIALADPRVRRDDKTERRSQAQMWAGILTEVPYDFALRAAHQHYRESKWPIMPADIATRWHTQAVDRLGRHTDPIPDADPDDDLAWRRQLADTRRAVALGHVEPAPHAIAAGPPAAVAELIAGIGRTMPTRDERKPYIPERLRAELDAVLPGRAARETARKRGDIDINSVPCPWCRAPVGQQCRRRTARKETWHRRDVPHPSRVDDAVTAARPCPACRAPLGRPCRTDDGQPRQGVHPQRSADLRAES